MQEESESGVEDEDEDEGLIAVVPPAIQEGEEMTTVGVSTVALSSSPDHSPPGSINEEALEVGTEKGIACKYMYALVLLVWFTK